MRLLFKSFQKQLQLFSIVIVPITIPSSFLDLKYSKLPPNKVTLDKVISIRVDNTASPLFYKFNEVKQYNVVKVEGELEIERPLSSEEKDAYFQLGLVYEGNYRPNWFVRQMLPEWLLKVLSLNANYGVGRIDFLHVTNSNYRVDKNDNIRDIKMSYRTVGYFDNKLRFKFSEKLRKQKLLGLWFRADGDDHKAKFKTTIKKVELN